MNELLNNVPDDQFTHIAYLIEFYPKEAKTLLTEELAKAHDSWGTLLHYAADNDRADIVKRLIKLGAEVDCLSENGRTPLMYAIEQQSTASVYVLLKANASIHAVDYYGCSPVHMVCDPDYWYDEIAEPILLQLHREINDIDKLVERLMDLGCNFYTATLLANVKVLECMLDRGYDVNSRGTNDGTALHVAAKKGNLELAQWLISKGANIMALDENGNGLLFHAAQSKNTVMIKLFVNLGVEINTVDNRNGSTPFYELIKYSWKNEADECLEFLLQRGAILKNRNDPEDGTLFSWAIFKRDYNKVKLMISHLALLHEIGKSITESVMFCSDDEQRHIFVDVGKYYELCQRMLKCHIVSNFSLLQLLTMDEHELKGLVRNETFIPTINDFCFKFNMKMKFPYYVNTLFNNLTAVKDKVKLENQAVQVICNIFNSDHNKCYLVARKIMELLDASDIEQLSCFTLN
ncbi:putative ankyrin repeat protein RF_0381 [Phymastichus coffea]|uniref:putative ankyrin repeat protein RF_0381 n=1 Tax=Phymastichus coffea TaxID=108790 RepID=UPI00273CC5B6|nr:putative ankyrin repeat protein RF_0381 [Phymastichus coffea]XP_058794188.1 putative ankyrin repeat protein RF_0381 [Phymastichus coffea]XP_058794189.1 putative ankyrin repeat protein RF_0381 [Phymastichus coffea]